MYFINIEDVSYLDDLLLEKGLLKVVPACVYESIPTKHLAIFGHNKGFYCLPTIELVEWLAQQIVPQKTIEIGAGHGALSRYMGIPATDSRLMDEPKIKALYELVQQPTVMYPYDIIKYNALEAIDYYKPECVIGCWITQKYKETDPDREGNMYGVDEEILLTKVDKYIMVGHEIVHAKKKILEYPHQEFKFPWIYSRTINPANNIIYMWERINF